MFLQRKTKFFVNNFKGSKTNSMCPLITFKEFKGIRIAQKSKYDDHK